MISISTRRNAGAAVFPGIGVTESFLAWRAPAGPEKDTPAASRRYVDESCRNRLLVVAFDGRDDVRGDVLDSIHKRGERLGLAIVELDVVACGRACLQPSGRHAVIQPSRTDGRTARRQAGRTRSDPRCSLCSTSPTTWAAAASSCSAGPTCAATAGSRPSSTSPAAGPRPSVNDANMANLRERLEVGPRPGAATIVCSRHVASRTRQ